LLLTIPRHYNCTKVAGGQACNLPTPLSTFSFTSGKTYLIRLINTSPQGIQHFSIDGHQITIIANDYVPVVPYNVTYVTLGEAQRVDILVKATGSSTGAYYMRSNVSTVCNPANQPYGLGAIYYENANTSLLPTSEPTPYNINTCANVSLSPFPRIQFSRS
jgi:FtsP/CotA-like multicopper oxidase with cupredoxin domain